jgi:flagellar biosynthetic protein FliR
MSWLSQLDLSRVLLFTLVFTRVSGLVMTAPIYGTGEVPAQVRVLMAFGVALVILPSQWGAAVPDPGSLLHGLIYVASELLIGLSLGLGITIVFSGIQLAGQIVGQASGLQLADVLDPAFDTTVSLFSRLLFLVALAAFVSIGGHRVVMAGLLDTFQAIPPGTAAVPAAAVQVCTTLLAQSFALAVRAAAPVMVALLLATLVLGLISRTLPQLNVMALGFGLNAMLTLGVLGLALGGAVMIFQQQLEPALEMVLECLRG